MNISYYLYLCFIYLLYTVYQAYQCQAFTCLFDREELIEYYRLMSETAAARERKALWRVRRHQLSAAREQWLSEEQAQLADQMQSLATEGLPTTG